MPTTTSVYQPRPPPPPRFPLPTRSLHQTKQIKDQLVNYRPQKWTRRQFFSLYVLYFSGHGDDDDGRFCVEKREFVTLDDILKVWAASDAYKAERGSKLLIVADSCHSGAMARALKALVGRADDRFTHLAGVARSVAVQAACGADEYAYDGVFTKAYVGKVAEGQRMLQRRLFQEARMPEECQRSRQYFTKGCKGCNEVVAWHTKRGLLPPPRCPAQMPAPEFYCPWGQREICVGGKVKPFPLYKRK
jgi:hypothetical protein